MSQRRSLSYGVRTLRGTGSVDTKLVQLIREIGWNSDAQVRFGEVVDVDPLRIQLDGGGLLLEPDDYRIPEHLTQHTRQVDISGLSGTRTMTVQSSLRVGDRMVLIAYPTEYGPEYIVIGKI